MLPKEWKVVGVEVGGAAVGVGVGVAVGGTVVYVGNGVYVGCVVGIGIGVGMGTTVGVSVGVVIGVAEEVGVETAVAVGIACIVLGTAASTVGARFWVWVLVWVGNEAVIATCTVALSSVEEMGIGTATVVVGVGEDWGVGVSTGARVGYGAEVSTTVQATSDDVRAISRASWEKTSLQYAKLPTSVSASKVFTFEPDPLLGISGHLI